ncbi:MAG: hypothetical protein KW806_02270 [Candidatus Yanofskybacteria bacterium]|nr:hypothetical protein [Candidatus Yanofskybacteria bacterium]
MQVFRLRKKRSGKLLSIAVLPIVAIGLFSTIQNFFRTALEYSSPSLESSGSSASPSTTPEPVFKFEQKIFGYSRTGRPIEGYEIGKGDEVIFLHGSIHGNEMGTADLLNKLIETIRADQGLVTDSKRLVIVPIVNPDGYYDRIDKLNANGVNLNLNFPTDDWELYGQLGTFAGPKPFSEVESLVIKDIVEQYKPSMMIAYHAKGGLVSPEDDDASIELAKWYARKTGYKYFDEWEYWGTATRWFREMTNKPAITVEVTDYLKSDWTINRPALLELISK